MPDLEEMLVVVSENNNPQTFLTKARTHEKEFYHRSIQVYIIQDGKIWIQQRPLDKKFGGKFEPVGGHVNEDDYNIDQEGYLQCARRETIEEVGIDSRSYVQLLDIPATEQTGKEFNRVYKLRTELDPKPNPKETIPEGSYFRTPEEIEEIIERGEASPSLVHTWPLIKDQLKWEEEQY